jgi:hypothetical protein
MADAVPTPDRGTALVCRIEHVQSWDIDRGQSHARLDWQDALKLHALSERDSDLRLGDCTALKVGLDTYDGFLVRSAHGSEWRGLRDFVAILPPAPSPQLARF